MHKQFSAKELQELIVPICSLAEQAKIIWILDVAETLSAEVDTSFARAEALCKSILKRAFAGELGPQDPTDEPAGVEALATFRETA